jgi:glutamate--cysteine ligase
MDCLTTNADALLTRVRKQVQGIRHQREAVRHRQGRRGTYGMGIMTVRDVKDLDQLSRRTKNKMSVIKDGQEVHEVIIQEGVQTYERIHDDAVAEPVVYMMDRYVVGGFYRVHPNAASTRT